MSTCTYENARLYARSFGVEFMISEAICTNTHNKGTIVASYHPFQCDTSNTDPIQHSKDTHTKEDASLTPSFCAIRAHTDSAVAVSRTRSVCEIGYSVMDVRRLNTCK